MPLFIWAHLYYAGTVSLLSEQRKVDGFHRMTRQQRTMPMSVFSSEKASQATSCDKTILSPIVVFKIRKLKQVGVLSPFPPHVGNWSSGPRRLATLEGFYIERGAAACLASHSGCDSRSHRAWAREAKLHRFLSNPNVL
jgi:hypothetical protein